VSLHSGIKKMLQLIIDHPLQYVSVDGHSEELWAAK
jgi:hypothetical protein